MWHGHLACAGWKPAPQIKSDCYMSEQQKSGFFSTYNLTKAQKEPKQAAAHQHTALEKLHKWFENKHSDAGSILVLPTGGGKTFTAMRFLCTNALSDGYKVLWLAHTHHLLEQAFYSLESEVRQFGANSS